MNNNFSQKVIALSILAAFGSVHAEEATIAELIKPESTVSAGLGAVDGNKRDRALFGQYNGMRQDSGFLLLDVDFVKRDDATGTWVTFKGTNLGLDNRELSFAYDKQGDWKVYGEYNEMVRHDPRTINTALLGAGSTTPTVVRLATPGTGSNLDLKLQRKGLTIGADKWLTPNLQIEASFKQEEKDGARMFGSGFVCTSGAAPGCLGPTATRTGWALLMLPEPVNSTTQQFEGKLNFFTDSLNLSAGYYGSFYSNSNGGISPTVPGTLNNALDTPLLLNTGLQAILQNRIALPPDNQAHQFYVSGNYAFTPTTKATFKYAYTHATQNDSFVGNGFTQAPAGVANLGAKIDTTLIQLGLTSRPIRNLSLVANVRYEDKQDKTPIALYNIEGANTFTNGHLSNTKLAGKLEASYQLPYGYRVTGGADYEAIDRGTFTSTDQVAGISGLRQKTDELGYRVELRKSMSETVTGMISYGEARRSGSNWLKLNGGATTGAFEVSDAAIYNRTAIFPMTLMNRDREKTKLMLDWTPLDRLSLQLYAEGGFDRYSAPTTKGLSKTGFGLYGIDASWTVTDAWKLSAYWSQGDQTQKIAHSTGYMADLHGITSTYGLGIAGKPTGKLDIGADLSYSRDLNRYNQGLDSLASATNVAFLASSGGLPDVEFTQLRVKFFGKYALEKNGTIRLDLIHERNKLNEWTWSNNGVPFVYSDGTTLSMNPKQNVTFLGATYIYKWQ